MIDPLTIELLFKAPEILERVAGLLGLIESVDVKLNKLLQSDFNAGVRCLSELLISHKEQEFLLKEGWRRFHTALNHESKVRKALAYIGLAFCQYSLNEHEIAINTLQEFTNWDFVDTTERFERNALGFLTAVSVTYIAGIAALFIVPSVLILTATGNLKLKDDAKQKINNIEHVFKSVLENWSKIPSEEVVGKLKQATLDFIEKEKNANNRIITLRLTN
jgi:hypothetical protein